MKLRVLFCGILSNIHKFLASRFFHQSDEMVSFRKIRVDAQRPTAAQQMCKWNTRYDNRINYILSPYISVCRYQNLQSCVRNSNHFQASPCDHRVDGFCLLLIAASIGSKWLGVTLKLKNYFQPMIFPRLIITQLLCIKTLLLGRMRAFSVPYLHWCNYGNVWNPGWCLLVT